jgi:hypothetical protein
MPDLTAFQPRLLRAVEKQLVPDERIGWVGQPVPFFYAARAVWDYLLLIPLFFIPYLVIVLHNKTPVPATLRLTGLLALAGIGVNLLIFMASFMQACRMIYAVTDQRVMIITPAMAGLGYRQCASLGYQKMGGIECEERYIGTVGNVILQRGILVYDNFIRDPKADPINYDGEPVGFFAIANACEVANALSRLVSVLKREPE